MTLAPGTRLGPYEIHSAIGAGGMGEVYRARDTRLHRDVAIKVLPELLASDADRLARFEREAQILAQLNHPNIAAIYGLEEGQGRRALVLEFVDGPTLADRITQGSLPLDEALPIAKQIAHALEAAHEHGIVHRDLKPANIKLRPDGTVKVLDFGLAKAFESAAVDAGLSISPTITSPAMMTGAGVILGTAAYMSPEQARGRAVDKRTDIWAFGCVFFEMLTATRAFGGDNVTDVVAAIVRGEPPWKLLPPHTPLRIVELLRRCLEKDPHTRLRDIGDARWEIEASQRDPGAGTPTAEPDRRSTTWLVPAAATFGLLVGVAATMGWVTRTSSAPAPQTVLPLARTVIDLPASAPLAVGTVIPDWGFDSPALALSPNGRYLAYVGQSTSGTMLYLRELASFNVKPLPGSEGAFYAFFAPDSSSVGFLTNDKVKKVSLDAGSAVTLCDAVQPVTATWAQDDTIYFSEDQGGRISSVPAGGGASTAVRTAPPSGRFSQVLPDGRSALITISDRSISDEYGEIAVVSLTERSVAPRVLVSSAYDGRYVGPGYLLFGRGGSLFAVRFDAARQDVIGEPAQVTSGVSMESLFGQVHAAASDNGLIAFVPGGERAIGRLAWVDRAGQTEYLDAPARVYGMLDLAPDGSKIAVHVADVTDYLWLYDILRKEGRRFTAGEASGWPVWGADSQSLVFSAWQSLSERRVSSRTVDDGTVGRELVGVGVWAPYTWSPDGRVLGASAGGRGGFFSISDGVKRGELFGEMPHFSPDGRWVVYSSTDVGRSEILVRSYPDGNITRQISVDGGLEPVWCACGELFFRKGNQWLSSAVRTEATLTWDPPRPVFLTDFVDTPGRSYDVSPDGKRLLVVKRAEPDITSRIHLVVNWSAQFPR